MELVQIGYFGKTHGIKGQLVLKVDLDFDADALKAVFIDVAGNKAPYFIKDLRPSGNGYVIGLEELDAIEKAKPLIGKAVYISSEFLIENEEEESWLGFELIDGQHGSLGEITGVSDNGQQVLLTVIYREKEIILPLVEDFIDRIDEEKKQIYFNAPEGLIDVYLE